MDEVRNQLVFGVSDLAHEPRIRRGAEEAGVPEDAVHVVVTERPVPRQSVQTHIRPTLGGIRITFLKNPTDPFSGRICTLGLNAYRGNTPGFVTASHCSEIKFELDGTPQHQNDIHTPAHRIGVEWVDPPAKPVLWSLTGRPSDAAFYKYDSGIPHSFGSIARTTFPGVNEPGSLQIDPSFSEFRVTSKAPNSVQVVHELVNKVGQTSGWTQGQVTQTCVWLSSGGHYLPCQWVANFWSQPGDSGSPVFQQAGPLEPEASHVALWGILWGGPDGDWSTSWYSPITGVEDDLGVLSVACDPAPAPCHPPISFQLDGPDFIPQTGQYQWSATNLQGGDGSYSFVWYRRYNHQEPLCDFQTGWQQVGTAQTLQQTIFVPDYKFEVRVDVTSGGSTTSKTRLVTPASSPECPL